jgi:hypothetical protein
LEEQIDEAKDDKGHANQPARPARLARRSAIDGRPLTMTLKDTPTKVDLFGGETARRGL